MWAYFQIYAITLRILVFFYPNIILFLRKNLEDSQELYNFADVKLLLPRNYVVEKDATIKKGNKLG